MAWQAPKTHWLPTHYFTVSDWARIRDNFYHLYDLTGAEISFLPQPMDLPEELLELPTPTLINGLESNLADLYEWFNFEFIEYTSETWYERSSAQYTRNPSYVDFNRWETLLHDLHTWLGVVMNPRNTLVSGTFTAGTDRARQELAREVEE